MRSDHKVESENRHVQIALSPSKASQLRTNGPESNSLVPDAALAGASEAKAAELSVIVPTFNEAANVELVVGKLDQALDGIAWEAIFVDDNSPDGTSTVAKSLAQIDNRVRCIRRVGRRGLAGACIEGMLSSSAPFVAVIDADLQHDETLLATMFSLLRGDQCDIAIGSRYLEDTAGGGLSPTRLAGSKFATYLTHRLIGVNVSDPMSGFFMLKRDLVEKCAPRLSTQGFKILADILASTRDEARVCELPYSFRARLHGSSKLDSQVTLDFLGLLVSKASGNIIPVRFVTFVLVGSTGLIVHLIVLKTGLSLFRFSFLVAQTVAALCRHDQQFPAE